MVYSLSSGKNWSDRMIKRLFRLCSNKSILDVGTGAGQYYTMLSPSLPTAAFVGIEVWEPYIEKYSLYKKYDTIINEDIREFMPAEVYGVTILGDVLAYMTKEEAIKVYKKILKNSEFVIISIPITFNLQKECNENPFEKYIKDDWSHDEVMSSFEELVLFYIDKEIGVYIGYNKKLHTKQEILTANKPTYAVYGIYKDEEKFIKRCLDSTKDVDEIILCDIGSKDKTNELIDEFIMDNPNENIKTFKACFSPFRFDDARNLSLSLIDKDIDICISLDTDEWLMDAWKKELDAVWNYDYTRYYHKSKIIWANSNASSHWNDRVHIRNGYCWKLPVHEIVEYKHKEKVCWADSFWIYHEPDNEKSRESYLPMLEQSINERPDVWKTWSFLADAYLSADRCEAAIEAIDMAFKIKDADKGFLYKQKYSVYKYQKETNLALVNLNNYIIYQSNRREPYFEKALYLNKLGRNAEAFFELKNAEKITKLITDYHYNPRSWGEDFNEFMEKVHNLAQKEGVSI